MFGISGEHLLVLLVILLIFGPRRLPDLGHSLGRTMKNFRDALNGGGNAETRATTTTLPAENVAAKVVAVEAKAAESATASEPKKEAVTESASV